jgi:hypothetical protein
MRRLILLAVSLYPARWRARYGDEFIELLQQADSSAATLLDVLVNGSKARVRHVQARTLDGGRSMFHGALRDPERLALFGLAAMLPTAVLVTVAVLKYVFGVAGPFDAIEPAMTPIVTHPIGETFFVLAPYVALLLALVPVTRLELGWRAGRLSATVQVATPALNLAVALTSLLLAGFMLLYWVAENL